MKMIDKVQIPIYRAKKKDSDEYLEGDLQCGYNCDVVWIWNRNGTDAIEIDPSTLAIHFPDMIDKNRTKIFASLSESGVGGDVLESRNDLSPLIYSNGQFVMLVNNARPKFNRFEVIGIHKG